MDHGTTDGAPAPAPAAVWRGTVRAVASGPSPGAAWALLGDFFSLDRWVSTVATCRRVEENEEDEGLAECGVVRYCEGPVNMAAAAAGEAAAGWSKERLLEVDDAGRWYSYEVVESNKGFGRYRATLAIEHDPAGCAVRWSFEAAPVKGWTQEGFVAFLEKLARGVARRLEEETNAVKGGGV